MRGAKDRKHDVKKPFFFPYNIANYAGRVQNLVPDKVLSLLPVEIAALIIIFLNA